MNRLFIELYLDEDVDVLIADLVRARGFHATTTQQAGRAHAEDVCGGAPCGTSLLNASPFIRPAIRLPNFS